MFCCLALLDLANKANTVGRYICIWGSWASVCHTQNVGWISFKCCGGCLDHMPGLVFNFEKKIAFQFFCNFH